MKSTIHLHIFLFVVLSSVVLSAQNNSRKKTIQPQAENEKSVKKKAVMVNNSNKLKVTAAAGDSVIFKDGDGNTLLKITDEGTTGSLTIPSGSAPSTTANKLYNVGSTLYFNGSSLGSGGGASAINDLSDAKTDTTSVFLGNGSGVSDDGSNNNSAVGIYALHSNTSGHYNIANGYGSLYSNTTGADNTAVGLDALYNNTTGFNNTANGYTALKNNTSGGGNIAIGIEALYSNTTGGDNTANGFQALYHNVAGSKGVAVGYQSQYYVYNTTNSFNNYNTSVGCQSLMGSTNPAVNGSNYNSAFGYQTLFSNMAGSDNTANGYQALYSNTGGTANTATGYQALYFNNNGSNTADGFAALYNNTDGGGNTASGYSALDQNTTGSDNTANGTFALGSNTSGNYNTGVGTEAFYYNQSGSYNTAVGYLAGPASGNTNLSNTTALGNGAQVSFSNEIRIGNSSVTSIGGKVSWTTVSDIRFKKNIKEDVVGLDFIMGLKPITYNLDVNAIAEKLGEDVRIDKNGNRIKVQPSAEVLASREKKARIRQSGFSAQAVEELAKKLGYAFGGVDKPGNENGLYGLRYAQFVVPLVKAVQEQQKIIETQKEELSKLKEEVMKIQKQLNARQLADAGK